MVFKSKKIAKLNSTEMDFWRRSAIISRKEKMNVTISLLDYIKTKQLQWYGHVQRMAKEDCQKKLRNGVHREEENEVDLNSPGRKGLKD